MAPGGHRSLNLTTHATGGDGAVRVAFGAPSRGLSRAGGTGLAHSRDRSVQCAPAGHGGTSIRSPVTLPWTRDHAALDSHDPLDSPDGKDTADRGLGRPVRVGLLVDGWDLPAWSHGIVAKLVEAEWASVDLVVVNQSTTPPRTFGQRLASIRRNFAYALYTRWDTRRSRGACTPDAFFRSSYQALVSDAQVVKVQPRQTKFSDFIEGDDLAKVEAADVDVLLRFGFRILRGGILDAARFGIWSFHHGDSRVNRGSMPGFWEVMQGTPTTGSVLQVLSEQLDAGTVLDRWVGSTELTSVALNKHNLYWKTAPMLPEALFRLYERGPEQMEAQRLEPGLPVYHDPLRKSPTNAQVVRGVWGIFKRWVGAKARHLFHFDQWFVAYRKSKRADDPNLAFYQYTTLLPPKDRFWADPFVMERDGSHWIFLEEFPWKADKAHISVVEIDQDGKAGEVRTVLDRPYHLSYPFLFEDAGELYMIPESAQNQSVELYRCTRFPDEWTLQATLMEGVNAVDTTLHRHEGKWWMFVALTDLHLRNRDTVRLYHADSVEGPWTEHPGSPIKRDVRSARPAGALFERDGRLYRPTQDCAGRYGSAITINEVTEWTLTTYRERVVERVTPDWDKSVIATHTLNRAGAVTVIDGEMLRRRWG